MAAVKWGISGGWDEIFPPGKGAEELQVLPRYKQGQDFLGML